MNTYIHTYIHTYVHTYVHTYAHTRTYIEQVEEVQHIYGPGASDVTLFAGEVFQHYLLQRQHPHGRHVLHIGYLCKSSSDK